MNAVFSNMVDTQQVLSWMHIGDLHLTEADQPNYRDLQKLLAEADANLAQAIDFVVLPGDNAEDGTEAQFLLVRDVIETLKIPLHILPGDHDFKSRSLRAFHVSLCEEAAQSANCVRRAVPVSGCRFRRHRRTRLPA